MRRLDKIHHITYIDFHTLIYIKSAFQNPPTLSKDQGLLFVIMSLYCPSDPLLHTLFLLHCFLEVQNLQVISAQTSYILGMRGD